MTKRKLPAGIVAMLLLAIALPVPVAATGNAVDDLIIVNEDAPATVVDVLANDAGTPTVTGVGTATDGTVTLDAGVVRYQPDPDFNGTDSFTYEIDDGPDGATVSVTVEAVNDAPSFTTGADETVVEDAGAQSVPGWATAISAGPADEAGQILAFTVTAATPALFSVQPAVDTATGTLTYTPAAHANGSTLVDISLADNGGTDRGGVDTSPDQAFTITIGAVNDDPTAVDDTSTVAEDSTASVIDVLANDTAAPDTGETLAVTAAGPASHGIVTLDAGVVRYTPGPDYNGPDSFAYSIDDGNGGSASATVHVTVGAVNDAPSFAKGADQQANEDAGPQTAPGWATAISKGPADESGQVLTFHLAAANTGLFSVQPAVDPSTGTLTWTPAPNANGSTSVTVSLSDTGGTAAGGIDTSPDQAFTITVGAVNDAPSFAKGADQQANEDAGPQTAPGWATAISKGPADESGQVLTFHLAAANTGLFSVQPAVDPSTGTLTWTPAPNANGSTTVDAHLADSGPIPNTSAVQTFTIAVIAVNDAPSFAKGANQSVAEDAGPQTVPAWATAISKGPADESVQAVTFEVTNDANSLFSVQPAVQSDGTLTYTPAPNAHGSATVSVRIRDDGGTLNGGVDQSATQTFTISVIAVNDAPSFAKGANQSVAEDAGPQTVPAWATAISKGPADESGQSLTFNVAADLTALFSVQPAVDVATGTLTYTPAADATGIATVSVSLSDNGGGADTSPVQTFTIAVTAVNDAPSFAKGADQSVAEDAGPQTVAGWATGMSGGPADEASQVLAFSVVSTTNDDLFAAGPAVDATSGELTWTPAADANGSATVTLRLADDGGTASGGADHVDQTFVVTVTPVNDAPSFTDIGNVAAPRASGADAPQSIAWASAISAGPADESGQVLAFAVTGNTNPTLFSQQPAVDASGTLTFRPVNNTSGSADVTVVLADDATIDGTAKESTPRTFTITVSGDNQPPVAGNDAFNVLLAGPAGLNVLADDSAGTGEPGDQVRVTRAYGATRGFLSIAPDGSSVTYDPFGCSTGTDSFKYTVTDGGGLTATATVYLTLRSPATLPAADGPRAALVSGSTIGSTVQVKLSWCGITGSAGLKAYRLSRSINDLPWSTIISSTTATSTTRAIPFAPTRFEYSVRVTDKRGRTATGYGPVILATRLQEDSPQIVSAGPWGTRSSSKASGGSLRTATSTSASASFTVSGTRQVGIVAPKGSGYGSMKVYVNGAYVGSFSQRASTASSRKLLYVRSLDPGLTYTIKLKPAGNGRVYLDAIVTLQ